MERSYTNSNLYGKLKLKVDNLDLDQDWLILNPMVVMVRRNWFFIELMSLMEDYEEKLLTLQFYESQQVDPNNKFQFLEDFISMDFNSTDFILVGKFYFHKSKHNLKLTHSFKSQTS